MTRASLVTIVLLTPGLISAQEIRRSQHGSVSQRVATTVISIVYNRPVARGRTLFGDDGVVHWGRMWHPGADSATTISLDKTVTIEGRPLPAGRYTLWALPEKPPAPWTLIFSRGVDVWHTNYPGESKDALRIQVAADSGQYMETLAYYFPMVDADSAVLRLHWGSTIVPVKLRTR